MSDSRVYQYENYSELQKNQLVYYVDKDSVIKNAESFEVVKAALAKVGVCIELNENSSREIDSYRLSIKIDPDSYLEANMRFAGPKVKGFRFPDNEFGLSGDYVYYSDVIFMLQTMNDKEVMDALGIKYASYYRHKKKMLESDYYQMADKNRLMDPDYLKGAELNFYDSWF